MKITQNLSLIFISVFFITCNLGKSTDFSQDTSQAQAKLLELNRSVGKAKNTGQSKLTQNSPSKEEEKYETIEGTKRVKALLVLSNDVTWIKTKAIAIRDHNGSVIPELEGKVRYSYSISPVKLDNEFTKYTMPLVLFETTKGNENLEVESFTLENDSDLDFNTRKYPLGWSWFSISIPKTEASSEEGYANTNPFGIIHGNGKAIPALTKTQTVKAKIRVRNKKDNTAKVDKTSKTSKTSKTDNSDSSVKEYSILLDSSYLVRLIKETLEKNSGIEKIATDFKLEQTEQTAVK